MRNTSLKQLIQQIANTSMPKIVIGVVITVDPIKIILKDDIGVQLSKASLTIPSGKSPKANEEWYMLSVSNNKIYYLLDKV